ncbi:MAG TPA: LpqB family beta-propeller domain-containing protein [Streptosporangiaceae bacterium]|nr:LpqB family beta-propeller domain-containing protein [Streptosporangiaceae bacterium]
MADGGHRADTAPACIRLTLLLGAILATLLATGCATIPSSGPVGSAPIPAPPAGGGVSGGGLIVEGPQPGWGPEQVVSGFLLASASFAHDHGTAREYLTPSAGRLWRPGAQVTILAGAPSVYQTTGRFSGQGNRASVEVSWQELATLDASGQYTARGGAARQQSFVLEKVNGQWRIADVPSTDGSKASNELLLPAALFRLDYAPRNLYFYGQPGGQLPAAPDQLLVPAPVFVPVQSSDLVTTLVNDLRHDPSGWLANGAVTAFPPGSRLRKIQVLPGPPGDKTAIVDIGLPRGTPRSTVQAMAAQLVWTLTSPAYSAALIQAVKLKINGRLWAPRSGDTVQGLAEYGRYIPRVSRPQNLYYVSTNGAVRMFGQQAHSVAVPGQAGTGEVPLSSIAVSMNGHYLAGISIAGPATVYTEDLAAAAKEHAPARVGALHNRLTGTRFSTPSWDRAGDLWVAGRAHGQPGVWVIPAASGGKAVPVSLPVGVGPVTGLRVAPDGVRIALIVGRGTSAHLMVGAITRSGGAVFITQAVPLAPGFTGPIALTWYDEDHLLVITRSANGTRLLEVPVNGDLPIPKSPQPGMASITAAGPQNALYVGVSGGRLESSVGLSEPWRDITAGSAATYPG